MDLGAINHGDPNSNHDTRCGMTRHFEGEEALKFMPRAKRRQMFGMAITMLQFANGPLNPEAAVDAVLEFITKTSNYNIPREWLQFAVEAWNELGSEPDATTAGAEVFTMPKKGGYDPYAA